MIWKKEKISVQTPFHGNKNIYNMLCKSYPIDEAKRFINEIKHLIIGFPLDAVLVYGFNGNGYGTEGNYLLTEWALDGYEWEQTFIFIINQQQFDASSLPYIVNFSDYHKIDESFYKRIEKDLVLVF